MNTIRLALLVGPSLLLATSAHAQGEAPGRNAPSLPDIEAPRAEVVEPVGLQQQPEPLAESGESAVDARFRVLEEQIAQLNAQQRQSEEARLKEPSALSIHGYIDFGFFVPNGNNGVGYIRDAGNEQFPSYEEFAWVFLGDILGSTVNSRGEAADLGDAAGIERFDSINSDGAPGFIVNEFNLRLEYALTENAIARASVNVMPRTGKQDFSIGDFLEMDIAELEYVLPWDGKTSIFVGKMLPVFGIE